MTYSESIWPPLSWWIIGIGFGATFVIAISVFLGPLALVSTTVLMLGIVGAAVVGSRSVIQVDGRGLTVGTARLDWPYVGTVTVLDRAETRRVMGVAADPRAFVVYRSFVPTSVQVAVSDEADPHPYWLISTRHPQQLHDALTRQHSEPS